MASVDVHALLAGLSASAATRRSGCSRSSPTRGIVVVQRHCRAADASEGTLARQLWLRVSHCGGHAERGRPLWLDVLLILSAPLQASLTSSDLFFFFPISFRRSFVHSSKRFSLSLNIPSIISRSRSRRSARTPRKDPSLNLYCWRDACLGFYLFQNKAISPEVRNLEPGGGPGEAGGGLGRPARFRTLA